MNKFIYSKLAMGNIKKNKDTYFPYLLSCTVMIGLFYILHAVTEQAGMGSFYGDATMATILNFGVYISGGFSVIFIFYTNSFLIKRRKKELGLYSILGMEKKHVGKVLFFEVIYSGAFSLIVGISSGVLLGRLMFALLLNILNLSTSIKFNISSKSIMVTTILFLLTFSLVMLFNLMKIHTTNPINLMKGNKEGEKEPKANWLMAVVGLICLGIGYYLALTVDNPIQSINIFFIAVIFVIMGTYFLFIAGSITILKILRKNKKFYYNKKHFIAVSSMIYRMKQNAVGLANICILSTAVLLVLSTTTSLYVGMEDIMRTRFPYDVRTNYVYEGQDSKEIEKVILNHGDKNNVDIKNISEYHIFSIVGNREENIFIGRQDFDIKDIDSLYEIHIVTLSDYNKNTGQNETLDNGEVLTWTNVKDFNYETLELYEEEFKVKKGVDNIDFVSSLGIFNTVKIVVPNLETMKELSTKTSEKEEGVDSIYYEYNFDLDGSMDNKVEFCSTLRNELNQSIERVATIENIYTSRQDFLSIYGSLLFIGLFLGTFFMIATVLIIYYKQISEGYDDHDRFNIMQKVGMSKDEVKGAIKSQIMIVFFLPLIAAIIHIMVAFPIVSKILAILNLTNIKLFLGFTGIVILIFTIAYGVVYRLTAKIYYKLVN
jgi:putative ABC transport system permease protein